MKKVLFIASLAALALLSFYPSTSAIVTADKLEHLPSGTAVTVSGFIVGNKLCNFPSCIELKIPQQLKNGQKLHGNAILRGVVQRQWQKEILLVEEVE